MAMTDLFTLAGYQISMLYAGNLAELQAFLECCPDYFYLVSGSPPSGTAAVSLLEDSPPGKTIQDKLVIGVYEATGHLVGVLDTVKDYPEAGDWWIGVLLLDPSVRNKGIGKRLVQSFEEWVKLQGAKRLFLGVVEENQSALRFWRTVGFIEGDHQPPQQFGSRVHVVITMGRML